MADPTAPDRIAAALAELQHGAFSRSQLVNRGVTDDAIATRLARKRWERAARGVFYLRGTAPSWRRQAMAATLGHPHALLAGHSAATLHRLPGFEEPRPGPIQVAVPYGESYRSGLAEVRRSSLLIPHRVLLIPTISPVRAFFDVATTMREARAVAMLEDSLRLGRFSPQELTDAFEAWAPSRRPGVGMLRALVEAFGAGVGAGGVPRTELERQLHLMMGLPGMPSWEAEAPPPWWSPAPERVDVYVGGHLLIVEGDSRAWHQRRSDMANDRRRDNLAAAHGHRVLRFMYHQLLTEMHACAELVLVTCGLASFRAG